MKFILKHLHHNPSPSLAATIRRQLDELGKSLRIDEAHVVVARRREASPPFRVAAHLVTPGPDVFAEADDHTLYAALRKAVAQLEDRIRHRHLKRAKRIKNRSVHPLRLAAAGARN